MVKKLYLQITDADETIDKLVKLVPADAIAIYLTLITAANSMADGTTFGFPNELYYRWGSFFGGLFILFVVRILGPKDKGGFAVDLGKVDRLLLGISIVAFFVWVYSIGGESSGPLSLVYNAWLAAALVSLTTFGAPYLYKEGTKFFKKAPG